MNAQILKISLSLTHTNLTPRENYLTAKKILERSQKLIQPQKKQQNLLETRETDINKRQRNLRLPKI